jgi:hypothetical protein
MKELIKFVQLQLNNLGYDAGPVDGIAGNRTHQAIMKILAQYRPDACNWDIKRRLIASCQIILNMIGLSETLVVDGYYGPGTEYSLSETIETLNGGKAVPRWRDDEAEVAFPTTKNPNGFPAGDMESMKEFYGMPGDPDCHRLIELPFAMRIAWNPEHTTRRMTVNKKLEDPVLRVLHKVQEVYGNEQIEELGLNLFGGCFNLRKKRGGSTLSTHAFAAAFDFDPDRNRLRWTARQAQFAKPVYDQWWKIWEAEGFVSLGREKNYDWMHIQATA